MRHLVLTIIILAITIASRAQVTDIQDHQGRYISTSSTIFCQTSNNLSYRIALSYNEQYTAIDTSYYVINLQTYSPTDTNTIPEGYHLLIKTSDGQLTDLTIIKSIERPHHWSLKAGTASKTYETTASYLITEQQLHHIIDHPIVKIRQQRHWGLGYIDFNGQDFDRQWNPSQVLSEQYGIIRSRLNIDNSIYTNF